MGFQPIEIIAYGKYRHMKHSAGHTTFLVCHKAQPLQPALPLLSKLDDKKGVYISFKTFFNAFQLLNLITVLLCLALLFC